MLSSLLLLLFFFFFLYFASSRRGYSIYTSYITVIGVLLHGRRMGGEG